MRTTLYAAFTPGGIPVVNVWDFNKKRLGALCADRKANGEAMPGEHIVRITVKKYREVLIKRGLGWAAPLETGLNFPP